MKGIVFTEFLEMVEARFSFEIADRILTESALPSGGVYTAVGDYDHGEMLTLVTQLSKAVDQPVPALVRAFGKHLFGRFVVGYPSFFKGMTSSSQFLAGIEDIVHVEVRKLYPTAQLPSFDIRQEGDILTMHYRSARPFADLAHGLIEGCIEHFADHATLTRADTPGSEGHDAVFTLTRAR
jgi:hypothetical protein